MLGPQPRQAPGLQRHRGAAREDGRRGGQEGQVRGRTLEDCVAKGELWIWCTSAGRAMQRSAPTLAFSFLRSSRRWMEGRGFEGQVKQCRLQNPFLHGNSGDRVPVLGPQPQTSKHHWDEGGRGGGCQLRRPSCSRWWKYCTAATTGGMPLRYTSLWQWLV